MHPRHKSRQKILQELSSKASEISLSLLTALFAFFYLVIALDGGIHEIIQAILAFCFIPVVFFWRSKPILYSSLIIFLLYAWSINWILALPQNLGTFPFILFLLLALYRISRYSNNSIFSGILIFFGFAYCIISPMMWHSGSSLISYRDTDQAVSWILIQWLTLLVIIQLARSDRKRARQKDEEERTKEKVMLDEFRLFQNQERMRIAREIHDILAHSLTLIKVQASAGEIAEQASPGKGLPEQKEALRNIKEISSDSLIEVRGIVHALRKNDGIDSSAGMRNLADLLPQIEKFSASGLNIDTQLPPDEIFQQLICTSSLVTQLAIRRIVDEALTNVLRHQGIKSTVQIALSANFENNEIFLSIVSTSYSENKVVFSGSGRGLIGMQERVDSIGGKIKFNKEDKIFNVKATLPIRSI